MPNDALDYLALLLERGRLTESQLAELITHKEGQHLEFKDGAIVGKRNRKEGIREIRRTVSAFGNADGGLLVIGVTDRIPRQISPCKAPGAESLAKWGESLIHDMAHRFSPPPRIVVANTNRGDALIFAVPRAPSLVECVIAGKSAYYLRVGESTLRAPDYLLSDLLLGRRQHPRLRLHSERVTFSSRGTSSEAIGFDFYFDVENEGLIHVAHLLCGVVTWAEKHKQQPINSHLRSYLEVVEPTDQGGGGPMQVIHLPAEPIPSGSLRDLPPFGRRSFRTRSSAPWRLSNADLCAAAYLLPRGSEPSWYVLRFRAPRPDLQSLRGEISSRLEGPVAYRAEVSWKPPVT